MDALRPYATDMSSAVQEFPFLEITKLILGDYPSSAVIDVHFKAGQQMKDMAVSLLLKPSKALLGLGAPQDAASLVAYASSVGASCTYCTMHTCVTLKREGVAAERLKGEAMNSRDSALRQFGMALGAIPNTLTAEHVTAVNQHHSPEHVEWFALSAACMGLLNTRNDLLGTPLEGNMMARNAEYLAATYFDSGRLDTTAAAQDDSAQMPPWQKKLLMLSYLPYKIRKQYRVLAGIPSTASEVNSYLVKLIGSSLSVVNKLTIDNALCAVALGMRTNLASEGLLISNQLKYTVGVVFGRHTENEELCDDMKKLLKLEGGDVKKAELLCKVLSVSRMCADDEEWTSFVLSRLREEASYSEREVIIVGIAFAGCFAPAKAGPALSTAVSDNVDDITPGGIMEIVAWMATLSMLNRMMAFCKARDLESEH